MQGHWQQQAANYFAMKTDCGLDDHAWRRYVGTIRFSHSYPFSTELWEIYCSMLVFWHAVRNSVRPWTSHAGRMAWLTAYSHRRFPMSRWRQVLFTDVPFHSLPVDSRRVYWRYGNTSLLSRGIDMWVVLLWSGEAFLMSDFIEYWIYMFKYQQTTASQHC